MRANNRKQTIQLAIEVSDCGDWCTDFGPQVFAVRRLVLVRGDFLLLLRLPPAVQVGSPESRKPL